MAGENLPPFYEVVRLTHRSEEDTLKACVEYRNTPAPEISLSWLRHAAYQVLSGALTIQALDRTIQMKLPPKARPSVRSAVVRLLDFSREKDWIGERLPEFKLEVGRGFLMPVNAVGRFHARDGRWVVGLQPRLDGAPDLDWQMQTWIALINEAYCTDPLAKAAPLVLDVSRDVLTKRRGFHVLDPASVSLIPREELNSRINRFIDCYHKATELVPVRPRRDRRRPTSDDQPGLPGIL